MTRNRQLIGSVLAFLPAFGAGCGPLFHGCSDDLRASMLVTVLDGQLGPPLCDAEVTVRDGTFASQLKVFVLSGKCVYSGVYERAGTYTVDVALGSRTESLSNVKVERGDCDHVVTRDVTISLP